MKMVEGQPQAFSLPACTDIVVQVCNQFKRIPLAFEIDVKEDNVLLARVEGDKMSRGGGIDSKGKPVDNRTEAQKTTLRSLLIELHRQYPHATIMGHRDIWGTDSKKWKKWCPCFDAKSEYKDIK